MNHFLTDLAKSGNLGQIGNIAVHVAIDLDVLDHIAAIGLQAAVEVVQVVDTAHTPGCGVEQLGGQRLGQWVIAFLFPATHQVIALLSDHAIQFGNLVGAVLQVGIHGDDHIALGAHESRVQCRRFAIVAAKAHPLDSGVLGMQLFDHLPRAVGAAVIDHEHLIGVAMLLHHTFDPCRQLGQRLSLII